MKLKEDQRAEISEALQRSKCSTKLTGKVLQLIEAVIAQDDKAEAACDQLLATIGPKEAAKSEAA